MKTSSVVVMAALSTQAASALAVAGSTASPVAKVLDLLSGLQAKIISEGEAAHKEFSEYAEWCEDRSKNVAFEITTGESNVADLKATIEKETAITASLNTKVEELSASIATAETDLQAATAIRGKEQADFAAEEKELVEVVDMLGRAIAVLERELNKGGASMLELSKKVGSVTQALTALVQASVFSSADAHRLTALVQDGQGDADEDEETGAPAAAAYEGHSDSIIDTLEDLEAKAQQQLGDSRNKETTALHNFQMLKQSLEDSLKFGTKDMDAAKKGLAESAESKATAVGDLAVTQKDLAEDVKTKSGLHENCMTKSQDYESSTKSRAEELKALAGAKKALSEMTAGADAVTYGLNQVSFLQSNSVTSAKIASSSDLANFEAVRFVRDLAHKQSSPELAQLASRMAAAMRLSSGQGSDPFAKVKGLISDMLVKLEESGKADASHKAYCDKETAESKQSKLEKEYEVEKMTTKIDQASARSAKLKEQVADLQKALADLAASQSEMDQMRRKEHTTYVSNKADMEQGLEGVKMGLKILREYYAKDDKAHAAAGGASSSIVGLLEVVESDFSRGIAEMTTTEDAADHQYEADSYMNKVETTSKNKDVEYKTKESVSLDKTISEITSDRTGTQAELDAVYEYLKKLDEMCIAKPESYEERARRRDAEIDGLKQALEILEGEAVLLQQTKKALRGVKTHVA